LTLGSSEDGWPIWTRDSRSIIFNSNRDGAFNLYLQPADGSGSAVRLTSSTAAQFPNSLAPGGRQVLAAEWSLQTSLDVMLLEATGPPRTRVPATDVLATPFALVRPLVKTQATEYNGIVSPDGRFFAYQSDESGRTEVYVKPFPQASEVRWQASTEGGSSPLWAPNGGELYYRNLSNAVIAVPFEINVGTWQAATPAKLIDAKYVAPTDMFNYDISPDGQRFLMFKDAGADESTSASIIFVLNWAEELKQRLRAR
jgi:serine/threonine-protein kinase